MWKVAPALIASKPLLGVGLNMYAEEKPFYDPANIDPSPWPVHDVYLLFAAEIGIPGTILLLLFFGITYARGVRLWRESHPEEAHVALAMLVGIGGALLYGMVDLGFKYVGVVWALMSLYAGIIRAQQLREEPSRPPSRPQMATGRLLRRS